MAAGVYDVVIEQGATFARTLELKDGNGAAVDITGATVQGQMRISYVSNTAVNLSLAITNAVLGEISWTMSAAASAALDFTNGTSFVYDIEIAYSNGTVERVLQGRITFSREATKS